MNKTAENSLAGNAETTAFSPNRHETEECTFLKCTPRETSLDTCNQNLDQDEQSKDLNESNTEHDIQVQAEAEEDDELVIEMFDDAEEENGDEFVDAINEYVNEEGAVGLAMSACESDGVWTVVWSVADFQEGDFIGLVRIGELLNFLFTCL